MMGRGRYNHDRYCLLHVVRALLNVGAALASSGLIVFECLVYSLVSGLQKDIKILKINKNPQKVWE